MGKLEFGLMDTTVRGNRTLLNLRTIAWLVHIL